MSDIKINSIKDRKGEELTGEKIIEEKPRKFRKILKWLFILIVLFIIGGFGGVTADRFLFPYLATNSFLGEYDFLKPKETEIIVQEKETVKIEESGAINEAIQKVKPAVVSIISEDEFDKSAFLKFSDVKYGSGFVVTSDGLIITDSNIVNDNTKKYIVFIDNGQSFESKAIYKDPASEITFVKIEADNLPVASFTVSDDLILGQKVISIGKKLNDFKNMTSLGVVRSMNSSVLDGLNEGRIDEMIFIDTEINSASSGGPLINLSGKICGLNILNKEKSYSYTIPIDLIKHPLDSVISSQKVERFNLGIKYVKVTPYITEKYNLIKDFGIYLPKEQGSILEDSLAYKAGLREGDLIYKLGDFEVRDNKNLLRILEDFRAGDGITVSYVRENKENTATIILE